MLLFYVVYLVGSLVVLIDPIDPIWPESWENRAPPFISGIFFSRATTTFNSDLDLV